MSGNAEALNRTIACQFLGDKGFEDVVATIRANGPLSDNQAGRFQGLLVSADTQLGVILLMLVHGLPESRYEKTGMGMLSSIVDLALDKAQCPEDRRKEILEWLGKVVGFLSEKEGKDPVMAQVAEKRNAVARLDVTMNNIMGGIVGNDPKPG